MENIIFTAYNSLEPLVRPDGTQVTIITQASEENPHTPTRLGTTSHAMSGGAGTTRVRGDKIENRITFPIILYAQLPLWMDFARAMVLGYSNPFTRNADDIAGHTTQFRAIVLDDKLDLPHIACESFSLSFNYQVVKD